MAAVCALSSTMVINASAISGSPVKVPSSKTTNGYTLELSAVTGNTVGSKWAVTNGGTMTLKSKNSIAYVKKSGNTVYYNGNNQLVTTPVDSTYQIRTVATSKLTNYSRLAKIEAAAYASCLDTAYYKDRLVYMNAYC